MISLKNLKFIESEVKMPFLKLPVRSVVVAVEDKSKQILISPGSKVELEQYAAFAKVSHILVPNLFHHAGVTKSTIAFPEAQVWAVDGIKNKVPDFRECQIFGRDQWPFATELSPIPILGMPKINEVVFYHSASKSLIVTDLCFNMIGLKGIGFYIIGKLFGTYNKLGVSRLFLSYIKNKDLFNESIKKILQLDFENLILSHGDLVLGNAKSYFIKALEERHLIT